MDLPAQSDQGEIEDTQGVDVELNSLIQRFITPIDLIRSAAAPATLFGRATRRTDSSAAGIAKAITQDINSASFTPEQAQESRCHAFYRALGLPVMGADGSFYNPGYNPKRTQAASIANFAISNNVPQNITMMQNVRENAAKVRANIFKQQPLSATIYTSILDFAKPFQTLTASLSFDQILAGANDPQTYSIGQRKDFLLRTYVDAQGNDLTTFFSSGTHVLRPFLVDPTIADTVMPDDRLICEPFLPNKVDQAIDTNKFLLRPGIEFILRLRLKQSPTPEDAIANQIIFTLDPTQDVEGLSKQDLIDLANALLAENKINSEQTTQIFTTPFELLQINNYIRSIKALVYQLVIAIENIWQVRNLIEWRPLPGVGGPADENNIQNDGLIFYRILTSQLDRRINELQLKSDDSKSQGDAGLPSDQFVLSSFENTEKVYDNDLNAAISDRDHIIRIGADAISHIEYITGEISGIGLVDMLSVYTALWAIDLDVLLSLLDDEAFNRLYSDTSLRNPNVEARKSGGPAFSGPAAITQLEAQIISILAFADKELARQTGRPFDEGGAP